MPTVPEPEQGFAIWVTGLPASGKSSVTRALVAELAALGVHPEVLESDALRPILTPHATYRQEDRDTFYNILVFIGELLTRHGVPVIFDATANRRSYRDQARRKIAKFLEVYVDSPLELCMKRDPKGIYRRGMEGKARDGEAGQVPGLQAPYEAPEHPEIVAHGGEEAPEDAARRILERLRASRWI